MIVMTMAMTMTMTDHCTDLQFKINNYYYSSHIQAIEVKDTLSQKKLIVVADLVILIVAVVNNH